MGNSLTTIDRDEKIQESYEQVYFQGSVWEAPEEYVSSVFTPISNGCARDNTLNDYQTFINRNPGFYNDTYRMTQNEYVQLVKYVSSKRGVDLYAGNCPDLAEITSKDYSVDFENDPTSVSMQADEEPSESMIDEDESLDTTSTIPSDINNDRALQLDFIYESILKSDLPPDVKDLALEKIELEMATLDGSPPESILCGSITVYLSPDMPRDCEAIGY